MDGAQFAKMLSDKHLLELNRMEYKYSTVSVKEFAELLRQNFAQPLPLTDFSGNKLFYLPNLAQISTNGMKQLLSVPVSGQNFGLSAMTEEIYATFQIESIRSTRSSIRYILDGYAPRDEQEARIYGMKRGLEFIANRQNTITEENLHYLYQISTGDYLPDEDRLLPNHFYRHGEVFIVGGEEPRPGLPAERLPGAMKCLVDFANANDGINELHKAAILHFAFAYYHPYFDGNGRTARLFHLWYLVQQGYPAALFTPFSRYIAENKDAYYKAYERVERNALISGYTDQTVWRLADEPSADLDDSKVQSILSALAGYVTAQIADADPSAYGFDAPLATVRAASADGTVTLHYAENADGCWMMVEGDSSVYAVDLDTVQALLITAAALKAE